MSARPSETPDPNRPRSRIVRVLAGDAAASLAEQIVLLVLMQRLVLTGDRAALFLALLALADHLPGLLLGPLCGVLLDRYGGRPWPLLLNGLRGLLALVLAALVWIDAGALALFAAFILERMAGDAYRVARLTLIPSLAPPSGLLRLNALAERAALVLRTVGPAAAGALSLVWGGGPSLIAAGVLSGAAGLVIGPGPDPGPPATTPGGWSGALGRGARQALRRCDLSRTAVLWTLLILGGGLVSFGGPLLVADRLAASGRGVFYLGLMTGAFNLGSILGTVGVDRLVGIFRGGRVFRVSTALSGGACLALLWPDAGPALVLLWLLFGLVAQPSGLILTTWTQQSAPPESRGRVLSLTAALQAGTFLAASGVGAGLHTLGGCPAVFAAAAILLAACAVAAPPRP